MINLIEKIIGLGIDKIYHFFAGLTIALLTLIVLLAISLLGVNISNFDLLVFPPVAALVAGILKELYDKLVQKEAFDKLDILATVIGSAPIIIVVIEIILL